VVVHDIAGAHEKTADRALPYMLAFLGVPLVLHAPTRLQLPRTVATSIPAHLAAHPEARVHLPPAAVDLVPFVREGIRVAVRHGAIAFNAEGALSALKLGRAPRGMNTDDVVACRDKARFVGRWFAKNGDPSTILTTWGLRL
jgi:hypothetical protein